MAAMTLKGVSQRHKAFHNTITERHNSQLATH
jgi:hypothetical protein